MADFSIPAEITRRVHADISDRFDAGLVRLHAGHSRGSGGMVDLAAMLGKMHLLSAHRGTIIRELQARQDSDTGLVMPIADYQCWPQVLAGVTSTLRVLGARLTRIPDKLSALTDEDALTEWLRRRNWDHPWGGATGAGHMVGGVLFALSDFGLLTQRLMTVIFDYLDSLRDDVYGVWAKRRFDPKSPRPAQLGGAYYFGLMYDRFQRPLDRPEGACRMLMRMQDQARVGTFCIDKRLSWPFGSTDHDALWLLARYSRLSADLRAEVMPAIIRYARYFIGQMSNEETYTSGYPVNRIMPILRTLLPDSEDDVPYWHYRMYGWNF